ncbi:3-beta hydroxysteroid dehydrogenase [Colletotrichum plurivorum]|uniref:3-beta hydroxysteroid dehydrogenase n=1 Tax=Colletotrichum plurivorum TaxID=2175906 RepID=A0A8H6U4F3_9PEZI|nr:3-beta hydroxysteroid dehydrogenase [Colletotrichum plurivorum]
MPNDLILLTGATGFVGFKTLVKALEAGYRVRCAVRSMSGIEKILATPSIQSLKPSDEHLSWAIVPDITLAGAYDDAVKGVKYIVHCASPVPKLRPDSRHGTVEEIYINPAVLGVIGILESAAAQAADTVKRVVITSSIVAVMPRSAFRGEGLDRPPFTGDSRLPTPTAPYEDPYSSSKTAALEQSEAWVEKHSPPFDLISIMPAWVFGRDELRTTSEGMLAGSNAALLDFVRGAKSATPINTGYIAVEDVADAHISALSPAVSGGQSFILSKHMSWEDGRQIAKKHFPQAFAIGLFSEDGVQPTVSIPTDASEGEKLLGRKYMDDDDTVKEMTAQLVELVEAGK